MSKMRIFKFWNEAGDEKEKESMSLKKAVMSVQGDFKDQFIGVEFISKKGKKIEKFQKFFLYSKGVTVDRNPLRNVSDT